MKGGIVALYCFKRGKSVRHWPTLKILSMSGLSGNKVEKPSNWFKYMGIGIQQRG